MDSCFHGNDGVGFAGQQFGHARLTFCPGLIFLIALALTLTTLLTFPVTAQAQGVPQPGGQGGQQGQGQAQTEFARIASQIGIDPANFEIDESKFTPANTVSNVDANGNPTARTTTLGGTGETGKLFINPAGSSINTNGNNVQGIIADHSAAILNQGTVTSRGNGSQAIVISDSGRLINQGSNSSSESNEIISSFIANDGPGRPTYILNERGARITSGPASSIFVNRSAQVINRGTIASSSDYVGSGSVSGINMSASSTMRVLNDGKIEPGRLNYSGVTFRNTVTQAWLGNTSQGTITGDRKGFTLGRAAP